MATASFPVYDFGGGRTYKTLDQMSDKEFSDYLNKKNTVEQRKSLLGIGSSNLNSNPGSSLSSNSSSLNSGSGSSLFGNLSSYTDQAKDLARFRLGLDQEQAKFSSGLRETEFQSDFGRNYKLADQQIGGQKDITNIQQSATTDRLQRQLESQQGMQKSGFDQQNLYRAQSAALALRGLR
jgi:hypothetical protein